MARICNINPGGGPVTIRLSVSNGLISGGDFKIYDFDTGIVHAHFKIATGNTGSGTHESSMAPAQLTGQVLSWHVLSCSPVITDSGTVKIEIVQDNALCRMEPHAVYKLQNVPNCSINMALSTQGGLHFL